MELLEQLRARKAEIQATAFVDGTAAQTEDIDAEILGLEQGTAEILAQARAARVALVMIEGDPDVATRQAPVKVARTFTPPVATVSRLGLQTNLVTHSGLVNRVLESDRVDDAPEPEPEPEPKELKNKLGAALEDLAALEEQRRELVIALLVERREKALDGYINKLLELGPIVAEVAALDKARAVFGAYKPTPGIWLRDEFRTVEFPIPHHRLIPSPNPSITQRYSPISWLRDTTLGSSELEDILAELKALGASA